MNARCASTWIWCVIVLVLTGAAFQMGVAFAGERQGERREIIRRLDEVQRNQLEIGRMILELRSQARDLYRAPRLRSGVVPALPEQMEASR